MSVRMAPPSSWNTPIESPACEQLVGLVVVEVDVVDVEVDAPVASRISSSGVGDDVEVAQAEEVHLQQAEVLDPVHLVLRDDRAPARGPGRTRACAGSAGTR